MKNEIWRDIEGFKGYCQVSSYGRARELDNGSWSLLDTELNGKYGSKPLIKLSGRYKMVEYLVCREFICKEVEVSFTRSTIKDDGVKVYILMHKDGSYLNNHVDNLFWKCIGDSGSKEVGEYLWDETRRDKIGYRKNMLLCIETGIGYTSFKEASEATGIDAELIQYACKHPRKSKGLAGDCHWKILYKTKQRGIIR